MIVANNALVHAAPLRIANHTSSGICMKIATFVCRHDVPLGASERGARERESQLKGYVYGRGCNIVSALSALMCVQLGVHVHAQSAPYALSHSLCTQGTGRERGY
jgi:hypothetical protein